MNTNDSCQTQHLTCMRINAHRPAQFKGPTKKTKRQFVHSLQFFDFIAHLLFGVSYFVFEHI